MNYTQFKKNEEKEINKEIIICDHASMERSMSFLTSHDKRLLEMVHKELLSNIGMLRQWINEDRITDSSKMVSNEEIKVWFEGITTLIQEMK